MTSKQYRHGLLTYYAFDIASEIPSNLVLKKIFPKIWLPFLTFTWGIITINIGFMRDYKDFMILRALLGISEDGIKPGCILYISSMYTRKEFTVRIGIFNVASSLSGAFGGLLARGLSAIGPRGGLEGWRWIFVMEGIITVLVEALGYGFLPNGVDPASFLSKEEREWAVERLSSTKVGSAEPFQWSEVRRGLLNVHVWLVSSVYFCIGSSTYSFSLFLPTIIKAMGIANSTNDVQLWSAIPYAIATPAPIAVAMMADRYKVSGIALLCIFPLSIIGCGVIGNIVSSEARFAMTCLIALGLYCAVPPILAWQSNNSAGHYKRAASTGLLVAIGSFGGFVASYTYRDTEAPYFHRSHMIIMGLMCYAWVATLVNIFWCAKINRDKKAGKHDEYTGYGDDRDSEFKMIL